jgi:acetyl esterase/lipase
MMLRYLVVVGLVVSLSVATAHAQTRIDRNVVYGMYSGLALLMDVHYPDRPNGHGIIAIQGSGWNAPLGYDAPPLKTRVSAWSGLTNAGYTLFAINHRASPRFEYPDAVEDAQRAVRYVRHNAKTFGIDSDRIGAIGGSSGAHLAAMLGTLDGKGDETDSDRVNRVSSKVQTVVAIFGPFDLTRVHTISGGPAVALFVGVRPTPVGTTPGAPEARRYAAASPITYVTADDPPFLLFHGDVDQTVPIEQSTLMERALKKAEVPVEFITVSGGGHGENFQLKTGDPRLPDTMGLSAKWFDKYLKAASGTSSSGSR